MTNFGLNILAQFVNNRAALLDWIDSAQPNVVVVMDDLSMAQAIRLVSPATAVIHRSWHPEDAELHLKWTPQQFAAAYLNNVPSGIVVQVLNEPNGYDQLPKLATWCAAVMALAAQRNARVAIVNFGVGHPTETFGTQLDDLWRAFQQYPQHILGLHEYFQSDPTAEPYRTGRFKGILARFAQLGIAAPQIVITEAGRDVGGGINDGWRAVFDEATYATKLIQQASVYKDTSVIGMCVFCYGVGAGGHWRSFDIENALTVLREMKEYNERHRTVTWQSFNWGAEIPDQVVKVTAQINVRQQPNANSLDVGDLKGGEVVTRWTNTLAKDNLLNPDKRYDWVRINLPSVGVCYAAKIGGLEFAAAVPPPPDPFPGNPAEADNLRLVFKAFEVAADQTMAGLLLLKEASIAAQTWLDDWGDQHGDPD